jgi:hypothetical protein
MEFRQLYAGIFFAGIVATAGAAEVQAESCEQIRNRIGVAPLADSELLKTLVRREDCRFTSDEAYRAAYGDRPLPKAEPERYRRQSEEGDDD